jgi:sugar lactone lactonase YvrE
MTRAVTACLAAAACSLLASGQDFSHISIEQIGKGFTFTEGPAWSKDGFLVFSDTPADKIFQLVPGRDMEILREKAGGPSGNAFDSQGRLYTCETRARRVTRTEKNGRIAVLADRWEGKRLNAPNDLAVSKSDHVYFTDPAFGEQSDHRELDFYGVYHITPKPEIKLVAKPAGRPNGIALSPNGRTLYVVNTDERNVRAYDLDHNGDPSNERVLIPKLAGVPDGIKTNDKGDLYVVLATGIAIYGADGHAIHTIEIPEHPSNCVFGDADAKSLYVTARGFLFRIRLEPKGANQPGR